MMIKALRFTSVIAILLILSAIGASPVEAKELRTALVIGNANYRTAPLRNPVNDAIDMADALKRIGFSVSLKTDADQRTMEDAIRALGFELRKGGIGLFYYAGHGIQVQGRNYLIPIDANIQSEPDARFEAVDAGRILSYMEDASNELNIIILDACRDNPFSRNFRSYKRGLAKIDAPSGSILAYATSPGKVAADGSGRNGLYTSKLLKRISQPGIPIELMFKNVRIDVVKASDGGQIPWESSSLISNFYFVPAKGQPVVDATVKKVNPTPPVAAPQKSQKQIVASIPKPNYRLKRSLRNEHHGALSYQMITDMIQKYDFYEAELNRSGNFQNRFIDSHTDTVIDEATGLMWQKAGSSRKFGFKSAKKYVKDLNAKSWAGFSDWRVPTVEEMASLIVNQTARKDLHLSPVFAKKQIRCWTTDHNSGGWASYGLEETWVVDFESGTIKLARYTSGHHGWFKNPKNQFNYLKAVRSIK